MTEQTEQNEGKEPRELPKAITEAVTETATLRPEIEAILIFVRELLPPANESGFSADSLVETVSDLEKRAEHQDADYMPDMMRIAEFAQRQRQSLQGCSGRKLREKRAKALYLVQKEIREIVKLYEEPPEEDNHVNSHPSTGGGKRVIRSTKSFT